MQVKKKVLFFSFDLSSHYLRCIVLAKKRFPAAEFEVVFLSSTSYNGFVEREGFGTFECAQFDSKYVMECSEKFDFSWLNEKDIRRILDSQVDIIKKLQPDIVVGDTAPTLKMASELCGVEYRSLMNGYMTKYYSFTRMLSRTHQAYKYSQKVPQKYFDIITNFAENISFRLVHKPFKKIRKALNLKKVDNYLSEMEGDQNYICDVLGFFPQNKLPSNYTVIGPLMYDYNESDSDWIDHINRKKPVIFVCMGSSGNWNDLNFLNSKEFSSYCIITAGDTKKVLSESHIVARDFVKMEEVVSISDVLICHGGNGTLYHALKHGVYSLCLTSHFEQEWNVHALERIGYGMSCNGFNPAEWKMKIDEAVIIKLNPYFS